MTNKELSFTDKPDGEVEIRGGGETLYFSRTITPVSDEVRFSNANRSFDRSSKVTTGGSNRLSG